MITIVGDVNSRIAGIAEVRRQETGDRIETFIIKGFDRKTVS